MSIDHVPEDMTATVDADVRLPELQAELARRGQWLPVDPPGAPTIRELLDWNASGPHRCGFGTVREHLIGIRARLADGREIKAGGRVVKNVAGFDLCKLFVGARGTLGEIMAATFKLRPLPEAERFVRRNCASLDEAGQLIDMVLNSPVTPVVLDLVSPAGLVVGFAGTLEEVKWQLSRLEFTEPATLSYNRALPHSTSVLPSKLIGTLRELRAGEFIARVANGVIYHAGPAPAAEMPVPALQQRLMEAFRARADF